MQAEKGEKEEKKKELRMNVTPWFSKCPEQESNLHILANTRF
jgi:hypothetical protein